MTSAQALLWVIAAGLLYALWKENRRLRADLSDTEQANEGLTEELDNWRQGESEQRARLH